MLHEATGEWKVRPSFPRLPKAQQRILSHTFLSVDVVAQFRSVILNWPLLSLRGGQTSLCTFGWHNDIPKTQTTDEGNSVRIL